MSEKLKKYLTIPKLLAYLVGGVVLVGVVFHAPKFVREYFDPPPPLEERPNYKRGVELLLLNTKIKKAAELGDKEWLDNLCLEYIEKWDVPPLPCQK